MNWKLNKDYLISKIDGKWKAVAERDDKIISAFKSEGTYAGAGKKIGLSGSGFAVAYRHAMRRKSGWCGLTVRAQNILNNELGLENLDEKDKRMVRDAISSKQVDPIKWRNCGAATLVEILRWCGLSNHDIADYKPTLSCPKCAEALIYTYRNSRPTLISFEDWKSSLK